MYETCVMNQNSTQTQNRAVMAEHIFVKSAKIPQSQKK